MTVSRSRGIVDVDVLEVVLAGAADDQLFFGHSPEFQAVESLTRQPIAGAGPGRCSRVPGVDGRDVACERTFSTLPSPRRMPQTDAMVVLTTVANADEAVRSCARCSSAG